MFHERVLVGNVIQPDVTPVYDDIKEMQLLLMLLLPLKMTSMDLTMKTIYLNIQYVMHVTLKYQEQFIGDA